jgi:uncharacterized membrane protein YciS (DUF1049 family)
MLLAILFSLGLTAFWFLAQLIFMYIYVNHVDKKHNKVNH